MFCMYHFPKYLTLPFLTDLKDDVSKGFWNDHIVFQTTFLLVGKLTLYTFQHFHCLAGYPNISLDFPLRYTWIDPGYS